MSEEKKKEEKEVIRVSDDSDNEDDKKKNTPKASDKKPKAGAKGKHRSTLSHSKLGSLIQFTATRRKTGSRLPFSIETDGSVVERAGRGMINITVGGKRTVHGRERININGREIQPGEPGKSSTCRQGELTVVWDGKQVTKVYDANSVYYSLNVKK